MNTQRGGSACYSDFCTKKKLWLEPLHQPTSAIHVTSYCGLALKLHHLSRLCCFFIQIGRSRQCMALKNFAWRSFWTLPSTFSRSYLVPDSRIISSGFSAALLRSQSEKWLTKSRFDIGSGTSTVCHARRHFQTCSVDLKRHDFSRGEMAASMPKIDEGTQGEHLVDVTYNE